MSIKTWNRQERPREKLMEQGVRMLTDAELVAILIGSGNIEKNAVELAREILASANDDLFQLGKNTVDDFVSSFKGIGKAKAVTIVAALELGRRRKNSDRKTDKINNSHDVFDIMQPLIGDIPYEEFWVLYLNRANNIIAKQNFSQGGTSHTVVDEKLIIRTALVKYAESLILCHNHPSGNINPSSADRQVTTKIKNAANYFSIRLLDHIIIAGNHYYAFSDNGEI